jgi:hypothetical protein
VYVHEQSKNVYLAHMKVGSRAVRDALRRRGFKSVYGHHGGPWHGRQQKFTNEPQSWWWMQDTGLYHYFATVRNHYDIIRTFWYWQIKPGGRGADAPFPQDADKLAEFIHRFMWGRVPHFHNVGRIFRFTQEVPNLHVWHYERQRDHLASFINLRADGLHKLPWEHPWPPFEDADYPKKPDSGFVTAEKPNAGGLPWQEDYNPATRQVVEDIFGQEMAELGYTFDGLLPNHAKGL